MVVAERALSETDEFDRRWVQLESDFGAWRTHYRELCDYLAPRNGRFLPSDRAKAGQRKGQTIYDNTASVTLRTAGAGITAGGMSPARPFFRLRAVDKPLNRLLSARRYLRDVTDVCLDILAESSAYRVFHAMNDDLVTCGTAAALVLEDHETTVRLHHLPIGEYRLAADHRGNVDTCYRTFEMTVHEIVSEFGLEACSDAVQTMHRDGMFEKRITVRHVIEPRATRNPNYADNLNMPWKSVYYEVASRGGAQKAKKLRESGYPYFPVIAVRWTTFGHDVYGSDCPGMLMLGDVKQLQHQQLRKAQGIDFKTLPPLLGTPEMRGQEFRWVPGGVSFVSGAAAGANGLRTAFETKLDLNELLVDIQDVRSRIREAGFYDLFLMLSARQDDPRKTATEIAALHEEQLVQLGPVIERVNSEMLSPVIRIVIERADQEGRLPPAPEELHGQRVEFEFVSVLAQAQRAVSVTGIERALALAGGVAQYKPNILDNIDEDEVWSEVSEMLGVPPRITRDAAARTQLRQAKIAAQNAQAQAEMAQTQSQTIKNAAPLATGNAAADVMSLFSGYNTAPAQPQ